MHHLHSLLEEAVDTVDLTPTVTKRFRAPTVDEALAHARSDLGTDVEVLEANRIRRGGVGGFFATDLGVELVVAPTRTGAGSGGERLDVPADPDQTAPLPAVVPPPGLADGDPLFRWFDEMMNDMSPDTPVPGSAADADTAVDGVDDSDLPMTSSADPMGDDSFARHLDREMAFVRTLVDTPRTAATTGMHDAPAGPDPATEPTAAPTTELIGEPVRARSRLGVPTTVSETAPSPTLADILARAVAPSVVEGTPRTEQQAPAPIDEARPRPAARRVTTLTRRPRRLTGTTVPDGVSVAADRLDESLEVLPATAPADARQSAFGRPADVVADAVNSLVSQLSHTAPVDGSRVNQLRRVQVTLTTAAGDVIQMAAELGAD